MLAPAGTGDFLRGRGITGEQQAFRGGGEGEKLCRHEQQQNKRKKDCVLQINVKFRASQPGTVR